MESESKRIKKYRIKEENGYFYIQRMTKDVTHPKWMKRLFLLEDYETWGYCNEYNEIIPIHYKEQAYKTTDLSEAKEKKKQFEKPVKFYY